MLGLLKCSLDRYIEMRRREGGQAAPGLRRSSGRQGRGHLRGDLSLARKEKEKEGRLEQVGGTCEEGTAQL